MHTISLSDEVYQALIVQAEARKLPVDELVRRAVNQLSAEPLTPESSAEPTIEERLKALAEWTRRIEERADRYPPDFRVDDSREAMYEERERAQL